MTYYILVFSLFFSPLAYAEDALDAFPYKKEKKEYVCIDRVSAKTLLQMRIDCPKLSEQIKEQDRLIFNKEQELNLMLKTSEDLARSLTEAKAQVSELNSKINDITCPSPWLGRLTSFIAGVAITVGVAVYLSK